MSEQQTPMQTLCAFLLMPRWSSVANLSRRGCDPVGSHIMDQFRVMCIRTVYKDASTQRI